jgi:hypothetical protein
VEQQKAIQKLKTSSTIGSRVGPDPKQWHIHECSASAGNGRSVLPLR